MRGVICAAYTIPHPRKRIDKRRFCVTKAALILNYYLLHFSYNYSL